MPSRQKVYLVDPHQFTALYHRILDKFKADHTSAEGLTVHPFNDLLRETIQSSPAVTAYLEKLNGSRPVHYTEAYRVEVHNTLYGNFLKANKGQSVKVNPVSLNCYVLYLTEGDTQTWQDFLEQESKSRIGFTEYTGYFYSFYQHRVLSCSFWINFSGAGKQIQVEEQGLHQAEHNSICYKGTGRKKNNFLFIDLTAFRDDYEDELKCIAYIGNLSMPNLMVALFMGISTYSCPMAGEIVLVKKDKFDHTEIDLIKRYLMLKRSRIRIRNENYGQPADLRVKKQPVSLIQSMIGTYWVWNFDGEGNIIQSKFIIESDYTSRFCTLPYAENENDQVCLLSISTVINRRLCMSTHPNEGTGVIGYVILNILGGSQADDISTGVFCSVGQHGRNPVSGKIVLMRAGNNEKVAPRLIEEDKINSFLKRQPKFALLYKRLQEIHKRRVFDSGLE